MENFQVILADLPDPRDINCWHPLDEIMFIALAAMLCGAQSCTDMQEFGEAKEPLLRQFLSLKHGVPSHDTFSRVFRLLDPEALEACFSRFVTTFGAALSQTAPGTVVAIDGKSLRRAYQRGQAHMPPLMVSAFATGTRITLAQTLAPDGNEVAGALRLFELISLKGCIVTSDALHCHRAMAAAVVDAGADYVLTLKGNQSALASDAAALLDAIGPAHPVAETLERAHDREERRRAVVVAARSLAKTHDFPGLTAIGRIEAWRTVNGVTKQKTRIFVLSKRFTPAKLMTTVRDHWAIENGAHWPLDVVFDEDLARNRKDNGPRNLAVMRRMTMNILRLHPAKSSIAAKRKHAGWNDAFFINVWTHMR
jgi:predicted transposase YbfD/YdcC